MLARQKNGFTLIELLVVISIIGLLSSVVLAALSTARAKARDSVRKQAIIQLRNALELYKSTNGNYPITGNTFYRSDSCNSGDYGWSSCTNSGDWIPGLAPTYIANLPKDPNPGPSSYPNSTNCNNKNRSYLYRSDNGTDYKLILHCSLETETIPTASSFADPNRDDPTPVWAWGVWTSGATNY